MSNNLLCKYHPDTHGQKCNRNFCPDEQPEILAGAVYDLLAKEGSVPPTKAAGRPGRSDRLKLHAATWKAEGYTAADIGAAITCLEHGRPLSDFQNVKNGASSLEALEKKGRRFVKEGKKLEEKIQSLMKGEGREEYEQKMILSAKEKKMRFIWTFMHFLDWWMKREEQFEYYAKN